MNDIWHVNCLNIGEDVNNGLLFLRVRYCIPSVNKRFQNDMELMMLIA